MKILLFIKKNWIKLSLGIILFLGLGFFWYISDYYPADNNALSILDKNDVYEVDNFIELKADSDIGFIFYPGGKVESLAYLVLLDSIRNEGINVFLVKMPFNLAVFNVNAADKIIEKYPNIKQWYIGGHSLGGAMASQYLENNEEKFDGLIQLSAYPLNESESNVLILYGSNDTVLDLDKLTPFNPIKIEGGNHAYFGHYGEQEGDGKASISRDEQQNLTVNAILEFIYSK